MTIADFLPILNIVLLVAACVGGFWAFKQGYSNEAGKIQEGVIGALKDEVATLRRKVDDLEKERSTQDRVIATIRYALRQFGLKVIISGDFVSIQDATGKTKTTHVQDRAIVKPLVSTEDDDEGDVS
jgi:hypothetical protein